MKALIADDDLTTRLVLQASLATWGYDVVEAATGDAAWDHLTGPNPALLAIVDWIMPGLSGPELCSRLKDARLSPMPYVIMLSSESDWRDVASALEAGADDFMAKPYNPELIKARLEVGRRLVEQQLRLIERNRILEQRLLSAVQAST